MIKDIIDREKESIPTGDLQRLAGMLFILFDFV